MSTDSSAPNPTDVFEGHPFIQTFERLCQEMITTHKQKGHDYCPDDDPHSNFNQAEGFGVDPFVGLMLRLNDKVARVKTFIKRDALFNESCDDALKDIAVYATIGRVMLKHRGGKLGLKQD